MTADITVVIPTLCRPSLERAVASVASQSLLPSEIIVVANGAERLDHQRIRGLRDLSRSMPFRSFSLPPFSGPSISRNLGAWEGEMPYVAFLDDDDEFSPGYIAAMWAVIGEELPDVVYGAVAGHVGGAPIWGATTIPSRSQSALLDSLYKHDNPGFGGSNVIVKRESFFAIGGFPVDLPSGEDRGFAMAALAAQYRISYVTEAVVYAHGDADGYRAGGRPDKILTNVKLMNTFWSDASWRARLRSIWRFSRSAVARLRISVTEAYRRRA